MRLHPAGAAALIGLVSGIAGFYGYRVWQHATAPAPVEIRPDLTFTDLAGKAHRLSDWQGKLLLVNFWASWCAPCLEEIPLLLEFQKQHAGHLQVVGPALDPPEPVRKFQQEYGIDYPVFPDEGGHVGAMSALGDTLGALPFSVLISPDGRILARKSGAWRRRELEHLIEKHLGTLAAG